MTTPGGSPELVEGQAVPETTVNEQIRRTEAGANHYLVVDKDLTSPPGSCADGATYIVGGGGGAWAGHTGDIAIAVGTNAASGWYFRDPAEGMLAWVQDEDLIYKCTLGTSPATWSVLDASTLGGVLSSALTELVQDIIGASIAAGTGAGVAYDDASGLTTISATGSGSSIAGGGVTTLPQGRLTLTSNTPIMAADATAASAVYYTPYVGEYVPIYESGSPLGWLMTEFSQLTLTLDTNSPSNHASGSLHDVFVWNDGGTVRIGTGPAWSSATSRGTGAGTTELQMKDGIWTNAVAIDLINNTTTYSAIPANEATYVGTIYCTANGQTGMAFQPAAAAGGGNNFLAVYNAYNRVRVTAMSRESTALWNYNSGTWRATNNSASNRISYVDGLAQSPINAYTTILGEVSSSNYGSVGINRDSTSATPTLVFNFGVNTSASIQFPVHRTAEFAPSLGFHYLQGMEARPAGAGNASFYGGGYQSLVASLEM